MSHPEINVIHAAADERQQAITNRAQVLNNNLTQITGGVTGPINSANLLIDALSQFKNNYYPLLKNHSEGITMIANALNQTDQAISQQIAGADNE